MSQVVHRIHEWMAGKLRAYSREDTGCLNHNTWTMNCKQLALLFFTFINVNRKLHLVTTFNWIKSRLCYRVGRIHAHIENCGRACGWVFSLFTVLSYVEPGYCSITFSSYERVSLKKNDSFLLGEWRELTSQKRD